MSQPPENKPKTGQLSFRLPQQLKNQFGGKVKGAGLEQKEILTELVQHYVNDAMSLEKLQNENHGHDFVELMADNESPFRKAVLDNIRQWKIARSQTIKSLGVKPKSGK